MVQLGVAVGLVCFCSFLARFSDLIGTVEGLELSNVLSAEISTGHSGSDVPETQVPWPRLRHAIEDLPGVEAVALADTAPTSSVLARPGRLPIVETAAEPAATLSVSRLRVSPGYLSTVGIRLIRGRDLANSDTPVKEQAVLVSQSVARRLWPDGTALGERLRFADTDVDRPWSTVVGVVGDVGTAAGVGPHQRRHVYVPLPSPAERYSLLVRVRGDPRATAGPLQETVRRALGEQVLLDLASLEDRQTWERRGQWLVVKILIASAVLCLILASAGLFALLNHSFSQRRHELGVRIALGARRLDVLRLLLSRALVLLTIGTCAGLVTTLFLIRTQFPQLLESTGLDPWAWAPLFASLLASALLACYLPARRHILVDPLSVLRAE